jgi:hypothetical protein
MVFVVWLFLTVPLAWPIISALRDNTPAAKSPVLGGTNYLIVAPQGLSMSAGAWAEYRRSTGYLPRVLITAEADLTFPNLREQIQRIYAESGRPYPFFLLLLGHAHPDSSSPESYLPPGTLDSTAYAEFLNGATFIASDSMYAAQDDDVRLLPMAIGRVPAHGDKEAMRVLARVKEYESQPPAGEGRSRIDLIASDSGFGPQFDWLAETMLTYFVSDYLPEYYQWRILYGNPDSPYAVPAQEFPGAIADRLNSDSLLVMYVGHGMSDYLGPIRTPEGSYVQAFGMGDLPRVNHAGQSIAMLVGCLIGDYDSAGDQPSLAEQLLLQPGGVAASYAASRVSSAEGNTFLLKDLLTDILQDRVPTVGEWTRRAEAGFTNPSADRAILMSLGRNLVPELYKLTIAIPSGAAPEVSGELLYNLGQHTYNLFGDPALRVEYPMPDVKIRSEYPWLPVYESIKFSGRGRLQPGLEGKHRSRFQRAIE